MNVLSRPSRARDSRTVALALGLCAACVADVAAQQPVPLPPQPPAPAGGSQSQAPSAQPSLASYRPPVIALVQPMAGAVIQQDRPALVFRFAPGEPTDPLDLATFTVTVDTTDRTRSFQVAAGEAWGSLAASDGSSAAGLEPGVHQVSARICSARGACAVTTASITVVPDGPLPSPAAAGPAAASPEKSAPSRRRRVLDALIAAAKQLLSP